MAAPKKTAQRPGAAPKPDPAVTHAPADEAPETAAPIASGEDLQAKADRLNKAQLGPNGWVCPRPKPKAA